jgi:arylsulfatase A-like enzyme
MRWLAPQQTRKYDMKNQFTCMSPHRAVTRGMVAPVLIVLMGCCIVTLSVAGTRPNIVFIMSDDHAYQAISCYDSTLIRTPYIDRLAREGVRFAHGFCTNAICAPSRAALLTGKYSHMNGVVDNSVAFDGSQQTFPKLLQKAGYQTALFGKWHLKSDPTGFDYWNILPDQGNYYNPDFIELGVRTTRKGYVTDLITDDCLAWLKARKSDKPFCVLLHHKAPHRNWMPDLKHLSLFRNDTKPLPPTFFDTYATRSDPARRQEMRVADDLFLTYDLKLTSRDSLMADTRKQEADLQLWHTEYDRLSGEEQSAWNRAYEPENEAFRKSPLQGEELARWKYQRYIKDYLRCIASIDENVGRLLAYLDESGLTKNTIVVYTSDQGFYLGEHGWFDKRFMYEESLRIPLIIRYPPEIRPGVISDMVLNVDFAPTFLDYAGVRIPDDMQGRSIREVAGSRTPRDWRQSIYYHYYEYPGVHAVRRHYGVRTNRYKLIHFYYDIDAWELFDLQTDPHELTNVYDDPRYAATVPELRTELYRLQHFFGDTDYRKYLPR